MVKEMKISLPFYKLAYALCFVIILSLVRGISYTNEIGLALEPPLAVLALAFVSDTYVQEMISGRDEIWKLYPMKKRMRALLLRMVIQEICLLLLSIAGYIFFFLFQRPVMLYGEQEGSDVMKRETEAFFIYLAAIAVTLLFWGLLSLTLSCAFRNLWAGIGGGMILWIITNSIAGDRWFGKWNLFSYTFREIETGAADWLWGKLVCVGISVCMIIIFPKIMKKRG